MRTIIWVTGKLGSGKTTEIGKRCMLDEDCREALYVGQLCRQKFGAGNMAKDTNPAAPESTEKFVREQIIHHIDNMPDDSVLYIDGVPRKPSQVRWIHENFYDKPELNNQILYVMCDEGTRIKRAHERDSEKKDNWDLMMARIKTEDKVLLRVLEEANFLRMLVSVIDNSPEMDIEDQKSARGHMQDCVDKERIELITYIPQNLEIMFGLHEEMNDVALKDLGITTKDLYEEASQCNEMLPMRPSVEWTRKYIEKAIEELHELLRELPDAWWSKDPANVRKARVELIDAWHFMMCGSLSLGMNAKMFANTYYEKRRVNLQRWAEGYKKRDKGENRDDLHIGKA